jgi:phosphatidylglycerol:prolipoprotein diacylglycerol transferase
VARSRLLDLFIVPFVILGAPIEFGIDPMAWEIIPRIEIGPLAVSPHGLGVAVGFFLGARYMARRARDQGGPDEAHIWNLAFWLLIGSMVGARLAYVLGHFSEVTGGGEDLLGVFKVWEGGISLLGGMTGAVLAGLPYVRRHRLGFWRMADLAAPSLVLGIGIGRIGDLLIGDHIGKPTDFALGWRCLGESGGIDPQPAEAYMRALARGDPPALGCYDVVLHQTALYDFVSAWVLFGVLIWLGRRVRRRGVLALTFVVWYAAMRVITDFLRVDKTYLGLTGSQIWALIVGLVCAYILVRYRGAPPKYAEPPPTPDAESSQTMSTDVDSRPG